MSKTKEQKIESDGELLQKLEKVKTLIEEYCFLTYLYYRYNEDDNSINDKRNQTYCMLDDLGYSSTADLIGHYFDKMSLHYEGLIEDAGR